MHEEIGAEEAFYLNSQTFSLKRSNGRNHFTSSPKLNWNRNRKQTNKKTFKFIFQIEHIGCKL